MLSSWIHHLYIKMRLRQANSGIDMDPKLIGLLWNMMHKYLFRCLRLQHLKITMLSNGFHHLYVIMRLRHANSGIDMDQTLIGFIMNIWCKSDAFDAWGFKLSKLGCLVVAFTNYISKLVAARKLWNWYGSKADWVYYDNLMQKCSF